MADGDDLTAVVSTVPSFLRPTKASSQKDSVPIRTVSRWHDAVGKVTEGRRSSAPPDAVVDHNIDEAVGESDRGTAKLVRYKTWDTRSMTAAAPNCLSGVKIFMECSAQFVERLEEHVYTKWFEAGCDIIRQGDIGDEMYILGHGDVDVMVNSVAVATLTDGAVFGEMALLLNVAEANRRSATIRAKTVCLCRVIHRAALFQVLMRFPNDKTIIKAMAQRRLDELKEKGVIPKPREWWRPLRSKESEPCESSGSQLWRNVRRLSASISVMTGGLRTHRRNSAPGSMLSEESPTLPHSVWVEPSWRPEQQMKPSAEDTSPVNQDEPTCVVAKVSACRGSCGGLEDIQKIAGANEAEPEVVARVRDLETFRPPLLLIAQAITMQQEDLMQSDLPCQIPSCKTSPRTYGDRVPSKERMSTKEIYGGRVSFGSRHSTSNSTHLSSEDVMYIERLSRRSDTTSTKLSLTSRSRGASPRSEDAMSNEECSRRSRGSSPRSEDIMYNERSSRRSRGASPRSEDDPLSERISTTSRNSCEIAHRRRVTQAHSC